MNLDWILNRLKLTKAELNGDATQNFNGLTFTGTDITIDTNVLKSDSTNNRIGINQGTPTEVLDVVGNVKVTGNVSASGDVSSATLTVATIDRTTPEYGLLIGGIEWQSATTPPTVKAGVYNVAGRNHRISSDQNLTLAGNILGSSDISLSSYSYSWLFFSIHKTTGALYWSQAFDTTSATVDANPTAQPTLDGSKITITYGSLPSVGMVANIRTIVDGTPRFICGKVQTSAAGVFTVNTPLTGTVSATLTDTVFNFYFKIVTLHAGGANKFANDATIEVNTPSPGFCPGLNIYGLNQYGIPVTTDADIVYRILGIGYVNASNQMVNVLGYKAGDERNDDILTMHKNGAAVTYGVVNTKIAVLDIVRAWGGRKYTYSTSANGGDEYAVNANCIAESSLSWRNDSVGVVFAISKNEASLTTIATTVPKSGTAAAAGPATFARPFDCIAGDKLRPHTDASAGNVYAQLQIIFK